jgi:hypothetical protein
LICDFEFVFVASLLRGVFLGEGEGEEARGTQRARRSRRGAEGGSEEEGGGGEMGEDPLRLAGLDTSPGSPGEEKDGAGG